MLLDAQLWVTGQLASVAAQILLTQDPEAHLIPQPPQLLGSDSVFTHAPEQTALGGEQRTVDVATTGVVVVVVWYSVVEAVTVRVALWVDVTTVVGVGAKVVARLTPKQEQAEL